MRWPTCRIQSGLVAHENRTNDVGLDVFEDIFGLKHGLHT